MNEFGRIPRFFAALTAICAALPVWAYIAGVAAYAVVYICRLVLVYRFAVRALDLVQPAHIPSLLNALTGCTDKTRGSRDDRRPRGR